MKRGLDTERNDESVHVLRSLIEKVVLTANEAGDELVIDLHGELAGILSIAINHRKPLAVT